MINKSNFIKSSSEFKSEYSLNSPSVMFRKKFEVKSKIIRAILKVCGLGYGYYYLNGKKVSNDLFTAPVSNYNKTLWYNEYDVTHLLVIGNNIAAVELGNGNYNESINTPWEINMADWRDNPKFVFDLEIKTEDSEVTILSDETWCFSENSPIYFNELRNGEYFDSRKIENFTALNYNDKSWKTAINDKNPPKGEFRKCECEPVLEMEIIEPISAKDFGDGTIIYDFGKHISGYIRLNYAGKTGEELIIKYAELLDENGKGQNDWFPHFYADSVYGTDKYICNGSKFEFSPKFAYHGFRYIQIDGFESNPKDGEVLAVFVHQAVEQITTFECSDENINKLFQMGINSTKSNLHYIPTDCPTREKLGWMNDAQASAEQFLTDFNIKKLLEKWYQDILDSIREDGAVPCIVPTPKWGYGWGSGPVSDGALFEIPYQIYKYTGDCSCLNKGIPYFKKYVNYINARKTENGLIDFGLCDWAGPFGYEDLEGAPTPRSFTDTLLFMKFLKIAIFACELLKHNEGKVFFEENYNVSKRDFDNEFVNKDGSCKVYEQTAVAMMVEIYEGANISKLRTQLKTLIKKHNYHLDCGMVGMRYLLHALCKCKLFDAAMKIVSSTGFPSYNDWIKAGATTMWETWTCQNSRNHHMYSDIISWFVKNITGIKPDIIMPAYKSIHIEPIFFDGMQSAKASIKTVNGVVSVSWQRKMDVVDIEIFVPNNSKAVLKLQNSEMEDGKRMRVLISGENKFNLKVK